MKILDDSLQTVTSKGMYDRLIPGLFQSRAPFEMMKEHFVTKQYGNICSFIPSKKSVKPLVLTLIVR